MGSESKNEMEQIQQGLEAFLEREIGGAGEQEGKRREKREPESRWQESQEERWREEQWQESQEERWPEEQEGKWRQEQRQESQEEQWPEGQWREAWEEQRREPRKGQWQESQEEQWPEGQWREEPESRWREAQEDDWQGEPERQRQSTQEDDWRESVEDIEREREGQMADGRKSRKRGASGSAGSIPGRRESRVADRSPAHEESPNAGRSPARGESRNAGRPPVRGESRNAGRPSVRGESRNTGRPAGRGSSWETDWDSVQGEPRNKTSGRGGSPGKGKETKPKKSQEARPTLEAGQQSGGGKPRREKRRRKKSGLRKFLIAVALIIVLLGAGLYRLVGAVYGKMHFKEIASVSELPIQEDGVVNILLIGNDSRENGDDGRSDAMILLSVSSRTRKIYMTSLLRDMYVEIDGHDGNRLNAAYSYGGAELLMATVEKNFDIPVNRYVLVNFEAFAGLVDAVGGVELELSSKEIEYVNGYLVEYNMLTGRPQGTDDMDTSVSGLVHLNGPQALAYSRNRYLGTDFGRTERQRKVLTAVIKKLPAALLTNAGDLMDGLLPNLTTNLTQNECFRLSLMAGKLLTYEIVSDSIPQPGTYKDATIRKMEVLEVDFETNIKYLKEKLYGK